MAQSAPSVISVTAETYNKSTEASSITHPCSLFWRCYLANAGLSDCIKFLLLALCTFIAGDLRAQERGSLAIMPLPAQVAPGENEFVIDDHFGIALKGYKEPRLE